MNIVKYYSQDNVKKAIKIASEDREIAVKFGDKGFGKRPDVIEYENDVVELAKQGATSFHMSEELWTNPLHLAPNMSNTQLNNLRKGWDLIIDIDTKLEYSKITADLFVKAIKHHNIRSVTCKFSGNKGFHIAVPFEAFPEKVYGIHIKDWFPEGPKVIAVYLKELIRKSLTKKIEEMGIEKIKSDFPDKDILENGKINPYNFIEIDTLLISKRHMIRMPYSLHEKSGLVSVPINPERIMQFDINDAKPENINFKYDFIDRENVTKNEARMLFVQALDNSAESIKKEEFKKDISKLNKSGYEELNQKIPVEHFPPCIKHILKGLKDGRKRSLFILTNFLTSVGWNYNEIENLIEEWNKKNFEPLSETLIKSHLNYHKRKGKKVLPPNCDNKGYYIDMQSCYPDSLCGKIKNPVNYAKLRYKIAKQEAEEMENKRAKRKRKDENEIQG